MTAEQIAALVATGLPFWWMRGDEFVATAQDQPEQDGDLYLLIATPQWVAQWGDDWQAASDYLTPLLASRLETGAE